MLIFLFVRDLIKFGVIKGKKLKAIIELQTLVKSISD